MRPRSGKKRPSSGQARKSSSRRPPAGVSPDAPKGASKGTSKGTSKDASAGAPRPPQGGHFLWGRHAVLAALANPERRIAAIHASGDSVDLLKNSIAALPAARRDALPPVAEIDRRRLDALHGGDAEKAIHQGMAVAVWPLDAPALEEILALHHDRPVRLICLDQLSDPRNVGAIMRSALALGAAAIIITNRHAPDETGALARAAAGALENLPLVRVVNLARAIEALQNAGITVAGLAADGTDNVASLADVPRLAIVMGAEGAGLRHNTRRHCDRLVRIDIADDSESLNVSIAAAIALYAAGQMLPDRARNNTSTA